MGRPLIAARLVGFRAQRPCDAACRMLRVPRLHPWPDALLKLRDNLIGHALSFSHCKCDCGAALADLIANVTAALRWRISPRWSKCQDFLAQMNLVASMLP